MDTDGTMRHDEARSRYEWVVHGVVVAVADYRIDGDRHVMHHTYTEPAMRGHGLAAQLVRAVLDDLRARNVKIVPTCWFVADFVAAHPEYQELVAA